MIVTDDDDVVDNSYTKDRIANTATMADKVSKAAPCDRSRQFLHSGELL